MKRLMCLLILCCYTLWGQANTSTDRDSLQRTLEALPHDSTRLILIQNQLNAEQANPKCIQLSDLLFKEATQQDNAKYAGVAIYFQIIYYYNQNQLDSVSKRVVAMRPYAQKAKLWDYYFDGVRCEIDLYSYREQFERSINRSIEMNIKAKAMNNIRGQIGAYQCLSNAYLGTGRINEAERSLKEAHKLLPKLDNIIVRNSVLSQLIGLSQERENNDDLIKYLKEQKTLLTNYIINNPDMREAFNAPLVFNNVYYAYYYNATKQPNAALKQLTTVSSQIMPYTYPMYKALYYDAYADYYQLNKEYDKALTYIDSTVTLLKEISCSDYIHQLKKKANFLAEAGRKQEALPIYHQVLQLKDSLDSSISNTQMQLIQSDYHIDRLQLEKEQLRNKIQLIALVVILLAIIALLYFMIRMSRIQRALKLSEQQTRAATQTAEEANEMKNRFLSNMSYNIRIPLNGVVGFSQLIAQDPDMDESTRNEYASIIQKNSEELMRLVNDVLDLSRLEANMMKFQLQQYDITELCNDALYMAHEINQEQVEVRFHSHIETTQNIMTDTARLTQALLSALTSLQPQEEKRVIDFTIRLTPDATAIQLCINNTPLADPLFLTQEVSIRHDINRLLLEHFGGNYILLPDAPEGPTIVFTYPLSNSE